ncbi:MAG: trigger factor [Clostridia bacterium]|nr:trigger factor [Clostridia bacterium]MDD4387254.1 trigger factor [Clostridia bacterium]
MNVKLERKENSKVELEFNLTKEEFNARLEKVFVKNAKNFNVPGFRPGKAPRNIIEKMYGEESLNYSVIEDTVDEDFKTAVEENNLEVVSKPELNVVQIGRDIDTIYTVTVFVKPEAIVKQYKGLEVAKFEKKVTDEDIDKDIEVTREKNSRSVTVDNRPLENGDISNIDFEGFDNGVAFEGGKGEKFDLTIGKGQFIPGFEEKLIGMNIGETKDIEVSFPADYHMDTLAGKPVVFKVTLNSISKKELPALDDEFARDISEFETLNDYKQSVKEKLEKKVIAENKASKEIAVFDKLLENTEVVVPEAMIEEQVENLVKQTEQELSYQGMTIDTYCQYLGVDKDVMKANFKVQAEKDVKFRLAIEAVIKLENIEVTQEDINTKIDELVKQYGKEEENNFKNNENIKQYLTEQLKQEKLINLIVESSIEK